MTSRTFLPGPGIVIVALCTLVVLGSDARPCRCEPTASPGCAGASLAGADWLWHMAQGSGVRQPFDNTVPAVACTLGLEYAWANGQFSVKFWDPLALAPAAGTVALRTRAYEESHLYYNHLRVDFDPPLVTTSLDGVAERGPMALAMDYLVNYSTTGQDVHYWTDMPYEIPAGTAYSDAGTVPLLGPHPVVGSGVCRASGPEVDLRVVQSVVTCDQPFGLQWHDFVQRFRVPHRCELSHVELAFVNNTYAYVPVGHVAIYDGGESPSPPAAFQDALAEADFYQYVNVATWETHYPFARDPVLEPDHDYWLFVYSGFGYPLYARARHGDEPAAFTSNIGGFFARQSPYLPWIEYTASYALDFRLVGTLLGPLAVPSAAATGRGLRLAAGPNPAASATLLRWSGAAGGARFEVLDARGRRVATHDAAGESGTWLWRGGADGGPPLPAGVYFVRATDREGNAGTTRVVLVR